MKIDLYFCFCPKSLSRQKIIQTINVGISYVFTVVKREGKR